MAERDLSHPPSQVLANIYLNEWDRYIVHTLKPLRYLRYGDDCIIIEQDLGRLQWIRQQAISFVNDLLHLTVNSKNDVIVKARQGIRFLGVDIFPTGRRLHQRTLHRALERMRYQNIPSYHGIIVEHQSEPFQKLYQWNILEYLDQQAI